MTGNAAATFSGTMPVSERHRFDEQALCSYLTEHIDGFHGPLEIRQFRGGQSNPTYHLSAGGKEYVLRRKPPGKLLKSAHAVDREYRVISALQDSAVPVARAHCLCEDEQVIGTAFYVMDCVQGRIFWDPSLPELDNSGRAAIFDEMNRVIAALHGIDPTAVGLADYGRTGNYFERQIARWSKQYRASETDAIEAMEALMDWLPEHIPAGDETAIVHGDYRLDNVIFHPSEARIVAVLDWELSTLGHPLADIAFHCMWWHTPSTIRGLADVDIAALGIPDEHSYLKRYCERVGRELVDEATWGFCMAFNLFRGAAIMQGIMGRVKDGTAASQQAEKMGRLARPLADLGWQRVQQLQAG